MRTRKVLKFAMISIYWLITRGALGILLLFSCLFFTLNFGEFPNFLSEMLKKALPGTLEFQRIQISPIPWRVDLVDVRIMTPDGQEVVRAETIEVGLDLKPILAFLIGESEDLLEIRFKSIKLKRFFTKIAFNEEGKLIFTRAFVRDRKGVSEKGKGHKGMRVHLDFSGIQGEEGDFILSFPYWDMRLHDISFKCLLDIGREPIVLVRTPILRFRNGVVHIRAGEDIKNIPRVIPITEGRVENFLFDIEHLEFSRLVMKGEGVYLEGYGRLGFSKDAPLAYSGKLTLDFFEQSPIVSVATQGVIKGGIKINIEGDGDYRDPRFKMDGVAENLQIGNIPLHRVTFSAIGGRSQTGEYAFTNMNVTSDTKFGTLLFSDGSFYPFGSVKSGRVLISFLNFSILDLLKTFGVESKINILPLPSNIDGNMRIGAIIRGSEPLDIDLETQISIKGYIDKKSILADNLFSLNLQSILEFRGGFTKPAIRLRQFSLLSGSDHYHMKGMIDLNTGILNITGGLRKDLKYLFAFLNQDGEGVVGLQDIRISGSISSFKASANINGSNLRFRDWRLDQFSGDLLFKEKRITVGKIAGRTPFGSFSGQSVSFDLPNNLIAEQINLHDIELSQVPPLVGKGIKGKINTHIEKLRLGLSSPLRTLDFIGTLNAKTLIISDRTFSKVDATVKASKGTIIIKPISLSFRNNGIITAEGSFDIAQSMIDMKIQAKDLSLPLLVGMKANDPLQGTLGLSCLVSGSIHDPVISAETTIDNLAYGDVRFPQISVSAKRDKGEDLKFSSEQFIPKLHLNPESALLWRDGRFIGLVLMLDINRITPQDIVHSIKPRDIYGELTGNIEVRLISGQPPQIILVSPPDGLKVSFFNREINLINKGRLEVIADEEGVVYVKGVSVDDGKHRLDVCGEVLGDQGKTNLLVKGYAGVYWLRALKHMFSEAEGYIKIAGLGNVQEGSIPRGCGVEMLEGDGSFRISDNIIQPLFNGRIITEDIVLFMRRQADPLKIMPNGIITIKNEQGRLELEIPNPHKIKGMWGTGTFAVYGNASMVGYFPHFTPEAGQIYLNGAGLRITSSGAYNLILNAEVSSKFSHMSNHDMQDMEISGNILITEGSFHKNFDIVRKAFSGVTGKKVAERSQPSVTQMFPWLGRAKLDLTVTGSRFGVRSLLPLGATDLDLNLDLAIKGTVADPEVWNRVEVLPGGKVLYNLVRREFEVVRGTIDFTGEISKPIIDVTARTRVEYKSAMAKDNSSGSRFAPDAATGNAFDEDAIIVTLKATGRYPELNISLSSTSKDLDQTDLQLLLLTGMTRKELTSGGQTGKGLNIDMLTEDLTAFISKLMLSPFVDAVRFGLTPTGGLNAEVMAHIGSKLRFETQVLQEQGGQRYSAGFQLQLTDRLSLEGRLRAVEQSINPSEEGRRYETKLRYRIPLD